MPLGPYFAYERWDPAGVLAAVRRPRARPGRAVRAGRGRRRGTGACRSRAATGRRVGVFTGRRVAAGVAGVRRGRPGRCGPDAGARIRVVATRRDRSDADRLPGRAGAAGQPGADPRRVYRLDRGAVPGDAGGPVPDLAEGAVGQRGVGVRRGKRDADGRPARSRRAGRSTAVRASAVGSLAGHGDLGRSRAETAQLLPLLPGSGRRHLRRLRAGLRLARQQPGRERAEH